MPIVPPRFESELEDAVAARHRTPDSVVDLTLADAAGTWSDAVDRLAATVPAGGRLVVDALSGADVAGAAERAGLSILAVQPFGLVLDGSSALGTFASTHSWRRSMSWLTEDPQLAELVRFLELEVVPGLPTAATRRVLVVLGHGDHSNTPADHLDAARLAELDRLLLPAHARYVGFVLLTAMRRLGTDVEALLGGERLAQLRAWTQAGWDDDRITRLATTWASPVPQRMWLGVDLTAWTAYQIVKDAVPLLRAGRSRR